METAARSERLVRFKTFELNLLTRELHRNGQRIRLRGHPIDVLAMLLERPGELVTREELRKRLWPEDTFVDFEQILNNSIRMLREALGDKAEAPRFVETIPRLGYRFIAPVETAVVDVTQPALTVAEAVAPPRPPTPTHPNALSSTRKRWIIWAATSAVVAVLIVGAVMFPWKRRIPRPSTNADDASRNFQIVPVTNAPGSARLPAFSPDEREVAFLWDGPERKHDDVYVLLLGLDTPLRLTDSNEGMLGAPAWSPDGREIAFSRCDGKNDGIYVVPALGGAERQLTHAGCPYSMPGSLAWLSKGLEMLMIDHCAEADSFDLVIFSLASGKKRCLTHSGPESAFSNVFEFSLSPDGKTVAFTASADAPCQADLYTIPLTGGAPHQLTTGGRCFADQPRTSSDLMWTPDSKSIVFTSRLSMLPALWRVSADGGQVVRETSYPAIGSFSRDGKRLVYANQPAMEGPTIWRADLASAGGPVQENRELIRTQYTEMSPQPSPDGTRIVWRSDRTGYGDIWMSGAAGENPLQLTHLGWYSGVPRWSPDGQWITFNRVMSNRRQIFMINSEGRDLRQVTYGPYENIESSWSRNGRSVYFASKRTGKWQIWKHALDGNAEVQVTQYGGFDSFESYDGQTVYFSKFDQAGIWSIPASGGTESLVIADKPQVRYWGYWALTRNGLYLLNTEWGTGPRIEFYDFATRHISPVFTLGKKPWFLQSSLSATEDGKTIYYTLYDQQSVIRMMETSR